MEQAVVESHASLYGDVTAYTIHKFAPVTAWTVSCEELFPAANIIPSREPAWRNARRSPSEDSLRSVIVRQYSEANTTGCRVQQALFDTLWTWACQRKISPRTFTHCGMTSDYLHHRLSELFDLCICQRMPLRQRGSRKAAGHLTPR